MHYAKYAYFVGFALLATYLYFHFQDQKTPTLDSLRVQAQESREREIQAQKDREAREDKLSEALYDQCLAEHRALTGVLFAEKQKESYECWKEELAKTNSWTVAPASSGVPERIDTNPPLPNVTNQSTVRHNQKESSWARSEVQQAPKTPRQWVGASLPSGWKVSVTPTVNPNGKNQSKGSEQKICPAKVILRNGWNDPRVQHAYNISCWDMDFIKTIEAESRWDVNASWDSHKAFWLCQINKIYNPQMQKDYKALKTDNEKVEFCYAQYKDWVKRWVITTRLYGYNVRNLPQNKKPFTLKP